MARPCAVCSHPDRLQIESEIRAGWTLRRIAQAHGLSDHKLVHRHKAAGHIGMPTSAAAPVRTPRPDRPTRSRFTAENSTAAPATRSALPAVPTAPVDPVEALDTLEADLRMRLAAAADAGDDRALAPLTKTYLTVIDKRRQLAPVSRAGTVDITTTPAYRRLVDTVKRILAPHPELTTQLAAALYDLGEDP